jgi:phosphohistidine phosphatase SixA
MKSALLRPLLTCLMLVAATTARGEQSTPHAEPPTAQAPRAHLHAPPELYDLVAVLRRGGYVVFMRHGRTAIRETDAPNVDYSDCAAQRNLSPGGVAASREMGEALAALGIPVGRVEASPYCRTMQTAREAFGAAVPSDDLRASPENAMQAGMKLLAKLAEPPAPGTNTFLVGHVFNALPALGVMLEEGESVVTFVDHAGQIRVAGRIPQQRWGDLARDFLTYGDGVFAMAAAMRIRHGARPVHHVHGESAGRPPHH